MVKLIIAISGKRKSGKDYIAKILSHNLEKLELKSEITGISHSLKKSFAKLNGLNYEELLTDGSYKEIYRKEMIEWGEEQRKQNSEIFCRSAVESSSQNSEVLIIADCRRPSDLDFFKSNFKTITIRIESSLKTRENRGFKFVTGIDDADSECALDNYQFDFVLENSTDLSLNSQIEMLSNKIQKMCRVL